MQHVRVDVFSAGNFIFNLVMIYAGMYLAGMLDQLSIIDVILPFGFGLGLLFFRPMPGISERTCTRLHLSSDMGIIVSGAFMLWLWVLFFGGENRNMHSFYTYLIYAAGLLLFKKLILVGAIYRILPADQFEPKCKICDPVKYSEESDEDDEDD